MPQPWRMSVLRGHLLRGHLLRERVASRNREKTAAEAVALRDGSGVTIAQLTHAGGVARTELTYERHIVAPLLQNTERTRRGTVACNVALAKLHNGGHVIRALALPGRGVVLLAKLRNADDAVAYALTGVREVVRSKLRNTAYVTSRRLDEMPIIAITDLNDTASVFTIKDPHTRTVVFPLLQDGVIVGLAGDKGPLTDERLIICTRLFDQRIRIALLGISKALLNGGVVGRARLRDLCLIGVPILR